MTGLKKNILRRLRGYRSDKRGNFNIIVGFMIVPLTIGVGMTLDINRQVKATSVIQDALDTAALYATTIDYETQEDLEAETIKIFNENLAGEVDFTVSNFEATPGEDGMFTMSADGKLDAMFMQIGGRPKLEVGVKAGAVARSDTGIELVIAFDTTASMGFDTSWDDATNTLEKVLTKIEQWTGHEGFYVSLVPFSDRVRIGTSRTSWLDSAAPSGWNGCVEPREEVDGSYQWSSDDDVPADEPFQASIPGVTGGLAGVFGSGGPYCPSVAVTGPTSNVATIITAAEAMSTNGGTGRFDDAMAWSWRIISSKWAGLWDASDSGYPTNNVDKRRKVVIFVTDGRTEAYSNEMSKERSWGWNKGSETGFEHMVHVCDQMKAQDIEIYMFRVNGNNHAASYMQQCATDADHYTVIHNNNQLELAFLDVMGSVKVDMHLTR